MEILVGHVKKYNDLKRIEDIAYRMISHTRRWVRRDFSRMIWSHLHDQSRLVIAYDPDVVGFGIHRGPFKIDIDDYTTACAAAGVEPPRKEMRVIELIAVEPAWQGRGIGKEILATAIGAAMQHGARELYASCVGGERGNSYAMCAKAGFRKLRTIENHYDDGSDVTDVRKHLY